MKYQLEITSNAGYGADQIDGITIGELKAMLDYYEDSDELVLHDNGNRYGANYGSIHFEINETDRELT